MKNYTNFLKKIINLWFIFIFIDNIKLGEYKKEFQNCDY